jgi:transcription elongation factor GreB
MSRAFVKDDGPEGQPLVPPRASLPPGVPNYVTPRGLALLKDELAELEAERSRLQAGAVGEHGQELVVLAGRITELSARIASARVVEPRSHAQDEVRFGATVTLRTLAGGPPGEERTFTIVGVDEAAVADGRVAFVAPIARAVVGKRQGEKASLRTARGDEVLEIRTVTYESE